MQEMQKHNDVGKEEAADIKASREHGKHDPFLKAARDSTTQ